MFSMSRTYKKLGGAVLSSFPLRLLRTIYDVRLSRGYNRFYHTRTGLLAADAYTQSRGDFLMTRFHGWIQGRTVLDLGCANGYFSLLAGLNGAREVLGIERNVKLRNEAAKVARRLGLAQARFEGRSIYSLDSSYRKDVVLAMAIIHWFKHTQRPQFMSMAGIFDYLEALVGDCIFVEYVAPEDPTFIQDLGLTESASFDRADFSREALIQCLKDRFGLVEHLGDPRFTRSIYFAARQPIK